MGNKTTHHGGMVLAEILLAVTIVSLALGSVIIVIGGLQTMMLAALNGFEAGLIAREKLAQAHLADFDDLAPYTSTEGVYTIQFSPTYRNEFTTNAAVDVSWQQGVVRKHRVFTDQIIDYKKVVGASDCDWLDQAKGTLTQLDFGQLSIDANNLTTDVSAQGELVYVSADSAVASSSDLYIIDVSDLESPVIVGQLNTGPGIASIVAVGEYVFAANAGSFQMQVVDVSDPTHPVLVSQAKLPGAIISGTAGFGQTVHYFDQKLFIGLVKNAGPEFFIIDVSRPEMPVVLGSFEIGATVNDIDARTRRAVVVAPGQNSVFLLDVEHPKSISEVKRISFDGWQTQGALSVEMVGQSIVVGRALGGFYSLQPELMLLTKDLSISTSTYLKVGASVGSVFAFNEYMYVTTSDADNAFQIIANATVADPVSVPMVKQSVALSSRGVATSCNSQGMYVVTQNSQDFFHIFTLP